MFFSSCNSSQKDDIEQTVEKPKTSIVKKHEAIISIDSKYESTIEDWKEYTNFTTFIDRYKAISPEDAINNSRELNIIAKSLNDSIKPKVLETPAFNARLNLLLNETLRLFDMSTIAAIKSEETDSQVAKVLHAFSSVNSKINTIVKQKELDSAVEDVNFKRKEFSNKENTIKQVRKTPVKKQKPKISYRSQQLKKEFLRKKQANFGKVNSKINTPKKKSNKIGVVKKKRKNDPKKDN